MNMLAMSGVDTSDGAGLILLLCCLVWLAARSSDKY